MVVTKFFAFEEILPWAYQNDTLPKEISDEKPVQTERILDKHEINFSVHENRWRKYIS